MQCRGENNLLIRFLCALDSCGEFRFLTNARKLKEPKVTCEEILKGMFQIQYECKI